jgi:hypothetical protein
MLNMGLMSYNSVLYALALGAKSEKVLYGLYVLKSTFSKSIMLRFYTM